MRQMLLHNEEQSQCDVTGTIGINLRSEVTAIVEFPSLGDLSFSLLRSCEKVLIQSTYAVVYLVNAVSRTACSKQRSLVTTPVLEHRFDNGRVSSPRPVSGLGSSGALFGVHGRGRPDLAFRALRIHFGARR